MLKKEETGLLFLTFTDSQTDLSPNSEKIVKFPIGGIVVQSEQPPIEVAIVTNRTTGKLAVAVSK